MAVRIMVHADTVKRDALSSWVLALRLKEKKYNVILCSRATYAAYYNAFRPDIVIQSHSNVCSTPKLLAERARRTKFVVLYTECAYYFEDYHKYMSFVKVFGHDILRGKRNDEYSKHITKVLTWGHEVRRWFIEEDIFKPEQIAAVGNPRLDEYIGLKEDRKREGIGVVGRFPFFNPFDKRGMFAAVDGVRGYGDIHYDKDKNVEDFAWYNSASLRIFFELLDDIILKKRKKILYKPHPNETVTGYSYFKKKYGKNFVLDTSSTFSEWLPRLHAMLITCSTSITEGFVNNVPVISIQKLMGKRLYDHTKRFPMDVHMPLLRFCHMPSTIQECIGLMEKAYENKLKPAEMSEDMKKLLYETYDWPRSEPSVETIAKEIDKIAELIQRERKAKSSIPVHFPVVSSVKMFLGTVRRMISYIRHPIFFKLDREYNYFFWHRKKYASLAKNVMKKIKAKRLPSEAS
jgi:surface carbohydrate biosynthesis protein